MSKEGQYRKSADSDAANRQNDLPLLSRASAFAKASADKMAGKLSKSSGWWRRCNEGNA